MVVDTLRADHLGLYGYERDTSPAIDGWAERAVVYERALATSPWTLPTFGSIFTGHLPSTHQAGQRAGGRGRSGLDATLPTVSERLRDAGWTTGAVVANPFLRESFGFARGFDHYDYDRHRRAERTVDLALDWLAERAADEPFFLFLHFIDPHLPYAAPPPVAGRFTEGAERLDPVDSARQQKRGRDPMLRRRAIIKRAPILTPGQRAFIIGRYDEEVAYTDGALGRLLDSLAERGLMDSTLVVLTADHGEELFDHGSFEHGHTFFQELLRVPFLVWGPGIEPRREAMPVTVADVAPTLLAAAGLEPDGDLAGISLWRHLTRGGRLPERRLIAEGSLYGREKKAILDWPLKLIWEPESDHHALYDLEADPGETNELSAERAEVVARLGEEMRRRLERAAAAGPGEAVEMDPELEAELRALGYLD